MILGILLLALILRLVNLDQSLWLDEAISVVYSRQYSFWGLITDFSKFDLHPFGHYVLLWIWGRIFSFSEISMRAPSVIFGVLTVFVTYLIGRTIYSKKIGLVAALLLAVNPLHIYYSQEARMYSMAAFAVVLNCYFFLRLVSKKKYSGIYYFLSMLFVMVSDYLAYLVFAVQLIFLLLKKDYRSLRYWGRLLGVGVLAWIFWLPIFLIQLNSGIDSSNTILAWKEVLGGAGIKEVVLTGIKFLMGRISFDNQLIYIMAFAPIGILTLSGLIKSLRQKVIFPILWFSIPLVLAFLISFYIPVYQYFRFIFVLPALSIILSVGFWSYKKLGKYFVASFIIIEIIYLNFYYINPGFQREDWKGLVSYLESVESTNSQVVFESNGSIAPFDYYSNGQINAVGGLKKIPASNRDDVVDFLTNKNEIFLLDYLIDITDRERFVSAKLEESGYKVVDVKHFGGVGAVIKYQK